MTEPAGARMTEPATFYLSPPTAIPSTRSV